MDRHDGMIARHRARMRGSAGRARRAAAWVEQHHLLAGQPCRAGGGKETGGIADMFGDHRDHRGFGLVYQMGKIILDPTGRFIAGGDVAAERHVAMNHRRRQHSRHGARLRNDAHPAVTLGRRLRHFDEGQRNIVAEVDEAEAIGPFDHHTGFAGDARDFLLVGETLRAILGKAGGKDHGRADMATGKAAHRVEHARARDGKNSGIDTFGQIINRCDAGAAADFRTLGIDQMDVASKALPHQIGQHRRTQSARLVRRTHDRDGPGPQQPVERGGCHGYCRPVEVDHVGQACLSPEILQ